VTRQDFVPLDITAAFPRPFGQPAAMDAMGTIAAPLLAGFAFTAIGLVLQVEKSLRWPDQALAVLVVAALLFITSLQASFNARRHWVPPDQWAAWLALAPHAGRRREMQKRWVENLAVYRRWIGIARVTYNLAIVALLVAVAVMLMPKGTVEVWRGVGVGLAAFGALAEIVWAFAATGLGRGSQERVRYDFTPGRATAPGMPRLRPDAIPDPIPSGDDTRRPHHCDL